MIPAPLSKSVKPLYLGAHTLRRMQPNQIAGIATRKLRGLIVPRVPVDFDGRYERRVPTDPPTRLESIDGNTATLRDSLAKATRDRYRARAQEAADGAPTFLNRQLRIEDGSGVDWYDDRLEDLPIDWSLKLYAFQPLYWACIGVNLDADEAAALQSTFDRWIQDWIDSIRIGRHGYLRRAWTPWAVSLRILHWSRYLAWREASDSEFEREFRRELYKNALFLNNHVERDVGGNHLIENGAALAVAGLLFGKQEWIDSGVTILSRCATEQFLNDGCHFERSPMYHVLVLTRYLSVCDLLSRDGRKIPRQVLGAARTGTAFLRYLRPPDGRIPLLNDSVYGQALPLADCLDYAETALREDAGNREGSLPYRTAPTYRWLRTDEGAMLVDGGPVGPPHLPGHSHSDTLSVLLWIDDRPVVTDTGTFGYVGGADRNYARGVRGHNTVQVGDAEPITLGGKYLMGPRPEPATLFVDGSVSLFEGCYRAKTYRGPAYAHRRSIYAGERWWLLRDLVRDHDGQPVRARFHLHPDIDASIETTGRVRLAFGDNRVYVYPIHATRIGTEPGRYFPEFGTVRGRQVLESYADDSGVGPVTLGCLITTRDIADPTVETDGDHKAQTLRIDGTEYRLPDERDRDRLASGPNSALPADGGSDAPLS